MRMNGKTGLALLLIAFGALLLLDKVGFGLGHLMGYLVPIALVVLGYIGIKNGKKFIGWTVFIIGIIALLSQFGGILGFLIAAGFIVYGVSLLRSNSKVV